MGLVSMMAATGMVLAGHAAQAAPTITAAPGTQAGSDDQGQANVLGNGLPAVVQDARGLVPLPLPVGPGS